MTTPELKPCWDGRIFPSPMNKKHIKSRRGFASMSPEKLREITSKGGKAAHAKGTAHKFTSEEAREAGRKGGASVSKDRAHMAKIARPKKGQKNGLNK